MDKTHEQEIARLRKERDDLRAELGEETTKKSRLAAENESVAQANDVKKKEITTALRKQQEQFGQEIEIMKAEFAQERAKWDDANKQSGQKSLRK
jgi:hypothetical protein